MNKINVTIYVLTYSVGQYTDVFKGVFDTIEDAEKHVNQYYGKRYKFDPTYLSIKANDNKWWQLYAYTVKVNLSDALCINEDTLETYINNAKQHQRYLDSIDGL